MTRSANLGFPRIGPRRELKRAVEAYWRGRITREALVEAGAELRARHWKLQRDAGLDVIPSNDFSFYDHMLDMAALLGAVPGRFGHDGTAVDLDTRFAMARGRDDAAAMEMTKWFDTNYHYIVPELHPGQRFALSAATPIEAFSEATALGIHTRPVLIGPVTFLSLAKTLQPGFDPLTLLGRVLPVYGELLLRLKHAGADWVQMDEPILALDLTDAQRRALAETYLALRGTGMRIMLTSYFEGLADNLALAASLPVSGLHVDLVRGAGQLDAILAALPADTVLSLGLVDGRNVWRTDLGRALDVLAQAAERLGPERLEVAPSCSLLHVPVDLSQETRLDPDMKRWMAFAIQKLDEVVTLCRGVVEGRPAIAGALAASESVRQSRRDSAPAHDPAVRSRLAGVAPECLQRSSPFPDRRAAQQARLALPPYPTTTIGSFPQTVEVRRARAAWKRGELAEADYDRFLEGRVRDAVQRQEALGLDVLVHGEFERNDMVEYFGERLGGFAFTDYGWVQSYGSRCVKPPLIFGDVSRPAPMTVRWSGYAQSLTERPLKAMLTGPVTILQWSFARDDQTRAETCRQIALAIRDEVLDLEQAGLAVIQVDEPALREGLPLRRSDRSSYLRWAVDAFRLATGGVRDDTQIHTHMCYSEFDDIMTAIAELDADVISIETSRSHMALLDSFARFHYPNDIGPGIWDIHSPRVPAAEEMQRLLDKARRVIAAERLWVNPDCGLKTRNWPEVEASIRHLVTAARRVRSGG